jgi:hypothetical protein
VPYLPILGLPIIYPPAGAAVAAYVDLWMPEGYRAFFGANGEISIDVPP